MFSAYFFTTDVPLYFIKIQKAKQYEKAIYRHKI